jgi:hypothetical protein
MKTKASGAIPGAFFSTCITSVTGADLPPIEFGGSIPSHRVESRRSDGALSLIS